jgi:2-polyprenyl-3-methyl-5-hydroxy-6-metoxy-1,4-benzoquinol methylase
MPTKNMNQSLKDTYNRIAQDWDKDHSTNTWWIAGTEKFCAYLKPGATILDAGCAGGMKTEYLDKKGFKVTGIDLSEKMIEIAKARMPQGNFFVADLLEPLKLDQKFDAVFVQAVLLHIPKGKIREVLANLLSVLNPGGIIYLAVKKIRPGQSEEMTVKENDYGYDYERLFSFYREGEFEGYLSELGAETVFHDVTLIGSTEWIQVIARKK